VVAAVEDDDAGRRVQQRQRAVRGPAVHHDVLEGRVVLAPHAGQEVGQIPPPVQDGSDDRDERPDRVARGRVPQNTGVYASPPPPNWMTVVAPDFEFLMYQVPVSTDSYTARSVLPSPS